jgi:hypothetical protein
MRFRVRPVLDNVIGHVLCRVGPAEHRDLAHVGPDVFLEVVKLLDLVLLALDLVRWTCLG